MLDNSKGQTSLDTGRFLWQSNGDVVEESVFSPQCAQPECASCVSYSGDSYRFGWPYKQKCDPFHGGGCYMDPCGKSVNDGSWQYQSRGYGETYNYGGTHYQGPYPNGVIFKGKADYPLAILSPYYYYQHSSRLQIYNT